MSKYALLKILKHKKWERFADHCNPLEGISADSNFRFPWQHELALSLVKLEKPNLLLKVNRTMPAVLLVLTMSTGLLTLE